MKINISKRHPSISESVALEFIQWRKEIKKPLTQRAFDRAMLLASQGPEKLGMPPDWVIEQTIDNGWRGINLEWLVKYVPMKVTSFLEPRSTRDISIEEQLNNRDWAH